VYHNLPLILEIAGALDPAVLEASIAGLIEAHPILACRILAEDGRPFLASADPSAITVEQVTLEPGTDDRERLGHYFRLINTPFDPDKCLFRVYLVVVEDRRQTLILVAHHAIADRHSLAIIKEKIFKRYMNAISGKAPGQEIPGPQFTTFVHWQRNLSEAVIDEFMFNCRSRLSNIPPLYLHTDWPRKKIHLYKAGFATMEIPDALNRYLGSFVHSSGSSRETVFLTFFVLLLNRYSQQKNITIGGFSKNRGDEALRDMVGPVSNLIAIRTSVDPTGSFIRNLKETKESYENSLACQDLPFELLVEKLDPGIDMSRTALFDVLFQYEPESDNDPDGFCFDVREIGINYGLGKYDLNLLVRDSDQRGKLFLTYNSLYFEEVSAMAFLEHFCNLATQLICDPDRAVIEGEIAGERERLQVLAQLDNTSIPFDQDETIVSLFERRVILSPGNTAIRFGNGAVTYLELNGRANRLARFLLARSTIAAESLIAIMLDRGEWQIVAMLAVCKLGAAYVPIDTSYPRERKQFILDDSGCILCIDKRLIDDFVLYGSDLDRDDLHIQVRPGQVAYVIYTSGSTGTPKGVLVEHRNVVRLLTPAKNPFVFNEQDVWTFFHSYCFDFSVWEMFGALTSGACLVIVSAETSKDASLLKELLVREKVTVLNQTPSAFMNLQKVTGSGDDLRLRYLIFGGEKLKPFLLARWRRSFPHTRIINMYGITETSIHTTFKEVTDSDIESGTSNIGVPLPAVSCFVLDEQMRILPPNIPGELYVGGAGVARGYLNRPELTPKRFTGNRFGPGMLYRSGDRVRLLRNGEMEYLERLDDQVKVRGFRIELAEVEFSLLKHESISDAVVILSGNGDRDADQLLAFIRASGKLNLSSLRVFLKASLPDHMIPDKFILVGDIPINENGKIDKRSLLQVQGEVLRDEVPFKDPSDEIEIRLAEIWREVLRIDRIGVWDDFFSLGGHSLKAFQVLMRIQTAFDIRMPVRIFFEHPTIESLAKQVSLFQWQNGANTDRVGDVETFVI